MGVKPPALQPTPATIKRSTARRRFAEQLWRKSRLRLRRQLQLQLQVQLQEQVQELELVAQGRRR